jgi:hypothetical protein
MAEITTININTECQWTPLSKDTIWQTGLKKKIWKSVVYNRPILLTGINTGLEWKAGRRFTKPVAPPKQVGVATHIS